jgi:hypothetical protein
VTRTTIRRAPGVWGGGVSNRSPGMSGVLHGFCLRKVGRAQRQAGENVELREQGEQRWPGEQGEQGWPGEQGEQSRREQGHQGTAGSLHSEGASSSHRSHLPSKDLILAEVP